jgi:copper transport protein
MRRVALAAAAALVFPASAFAHAALEHASPRFQQRLERAPRAVVLRFDQSVKPSPNSIEVRNAHGRLFSRAATSASAGTTLRVPLTHLPRGVYTVRWHALSADGHVVSGVFTFGVREQAPPPTEAYGAGGPTTSEDIVRWAYFVSLALLLGGLAFRLLVLRGPVRPEVERRFYALAGLGVVGTIESGIAAFLMRAEDALQLPFGRLLYGDLSPLANHTRFGTAFIAMTLGYALVAALVFLAWLTDRTLLLVPAFLLGLGFASGLSLSGHSAVDPGSSWVSALADWVHLCGASIWIGGLVHLAVGVWPVAPDLRRRAFVGFSQLATVLIALVLAAGTYLAVVRLPAASDLWTTHYGRVLLVKLTFVALALAWGAFHHFTVRPALERGAGERLLRAGFSRSLVAESAVGMAVLLVAAVLVNSKPPPQPAPSKTVARAVSR